MRMRAISERLNRYDRRSIVFKSLLSLLSDHFLVRYSFHKCVSLILGHDALIVC